MKLTMSYASVEALREFARAVPVAIREMENDSDEFRANYRALSSYLGVRDEQFREIVEACIRAVELAAEDIDFLPASLYDTADAIEDWLRKHVGADISAAEATGATTDGSPTRRGENVYSTYNVTKR